MHSRLQASVAKQDAQNGYSLPDVKPRNACVQPLRTERVKQEDRKDRQTLERVRLIHSLVWGVSHIHGLDSGFVSALTSLSDHKGRVDSMSGESLLNVAILTEAGTARGFGHLARCCALYDAFESLGVGVELVVRGQAPEHIIESRRCVTTEWATPEAVSRLLVEKDAAVIDSYEADAATYSAAERAVHWAAYLDDTMRLAYPRGLVVNGSPAAPSMAYEPVYGDAVLLGARYQLLRKAFWEVPARCAARPSLSRVLVIFGGTDARDLRESTVELLADRFPDVVLDVVDDPRTAAEIRDAMLAADVAVTAAGQTLYELARTGTPAVAVAVADNQIPQARALADAGVIVLAGEAGEFAVRERIADGLASLEPMDAREQMSRRGPQLIDGRGALRVARAVLGRALRERVRLQAATPRDEDAVLALANDPVVRASSLNTEPITPEAHRAWFAHRLMRPRESMMLLAWDDGALAGQVRFDVSGNQAVVSISLAAGYRGLGWGPLLLEDAIRRLGREHTDVTTLIANVRRENTASIRLFEGAGFVSDGADAGVGSVAITFRRAVASE